MGSRPDRGVWFVADGMGGHASGAVASRIVRETMLEYAGAERLTEAVVRSHAAILAEGAAHPDRQDMGSTIVAAQIAGKAANIAWVGDSRAYAFRHGKLQRLTRDHAYVEHLLQSGAITEEEARSHPNRNVITRGLGMEESAPSAVEFPLRRHDWLLLCSDGLTDELADSDIERILLAASTLDSAADALIANALANGGRDNVSVVLIDYDGASHWSSWMPRLPPELVWPIAAGVAAGVVAAMIGWLVLNHRAQ